MLDGGQTEHLCSGSMVSCFTWQEGRASGNECLYQPPHSVPHRLSKPWVSPSLRLSQIQPFPSPDSTNRNAAASRLATVESIGAGGAPEWMLVETWLQPAEVGKIQRYSSLQNYTCTYASFDITILLTE